MQNALIVAALVGVARTASAQETAAPADTPAVAAGPKEPPSVGGRGRVVVDLAGLGGVSGGALIGVGGVGGLGGFAGPFYVSSVGKDVMVGVAPSADAFVTERLSLGGRLSAALVSAGGIQGTTFGVAPRIGYALPISSSFAFWPRLGVGADFTRGFGSTYFTEVDAGFVTRVSKHLLLDLGPVVAVRRRSFEGSDITTVDARARVALRLDF